MIWSQYCNNPTSKMTIMPDGSMHYAEQGWWVLSLDEVEEMMKK